MSVPRPDSIRLDLKVTPLFDLCATLYVDGSCRRHEVRVLPRTLSGREIFTRVAALRESVPGISAEECHQLVPAVSIEIPPSTPLVPLGPWETLQRIVAALTDAPQPPRATSAGDTTKGRFEQELTTVETRR